MVTHEIAVIATRTAITKTILVLFFFMMTSFLRPVSIEYRIVPVLSFWLLLKTIASNRA